ncbi:MAG: PLP-dependent transferase [Candidatus Zixiibacteriota bacterium]|nr:MAG: PLP-dependent transferase [candidate division Zixibacteria bacterium]
MADNDSTRRRFATRAIHAGLVPEDGTRSVTTAIYPSSTYRVAFPGDDSGYVYSRWANPTRNALERGLASLENATHAYAFSSGLSALMTVMHLLKAGDHVVASDDLYGGTVRQFEQVLKNFNLDFTYVDGTNPENFAAAVRKNTRLFWIETPTNPLLKVIDIAAVSTIAKKHDILVAVDNTFATPYLQHPLDCGADIVHHSASKYLGGHCDVIAGALIVRDEQLAEQIRFLQNANGVQLGPFESWLILRGMKTLPVRMERHCANAAKVAAFLQSVDAVSRVYFPGLDGDTLPNNMAGPGGMVSFDLEADFETVKTFATSTELFILAESLGGVESLINHPASMTHASIPKEVREKHGIGDSLIRLSVGLEAIEDLIEDLTRAFTRIGAKVG